MSSQEIGGAAGTATILTTGAGFELTAVAPVAFGGSSPATANNNVTFAASYGATGANTIAQTDGATATTLNRGSSAITVNMSATKSAGDTFESGTYDATVVLTCE
jgi:hypothetical protein